MDIYIEGLVWYVFFLDCLLYNIMVWTKGRWHKQTAHWLSAWFPLNAFFGIFYLFLVLWTGFTLYRMQLLGFYWG